MIKSMAAYPHQLSEEYANKIAKTIAAAKRFNFDEIFTTIHLPEYSLLEQIEALKIINTETKRYNLEITVDIGGRFINSLLTDPTLTEEMRNMKIDFIRLDYGFSEIEIAELYRYLKIRGFVINASTYSIDETERIIKMFKNVDPSIEIRACHNYYILGNTGIDPEFALTQDRFFIENDIPVYYCVPTYAHPRQPLNLGLCTLEKHRFQKIDYILADLIINHQIKAFMIADEWTDEDDLLLATATLANLNSGLAPLTDIEIEFYDDAKPIERDIILKEHLIRYDSPFDLLRSVSSRQMAETAELIEPNNITDICAGDIVINNRLNKRYSGELQVASKDYCRNEGLNVVARIKNRTDLVKLWRYKEQKRYRFVEKV